MSAATFALGERLVAELKLVESTDTLARWMAHYVAELMVRAKNAPLPEHNKSHEACARAILDLWSQAQAFPVKPKPFNSVDRVIEAIDSLHPDGGPHYRNDLWRAIDQRADDRDSEVENFLAIALGIDDAARNLIHHVLAHASRAAGRDDSEWLELAQQLQEGDPLSQLRIRIVRAGQDEAVLKDHRIGHLEKRIAQLEYFVAVAEVLRTSLMESVAAAEKEVSHILSEEHEEPKS